MMKKRILSLLLVVVLVAIMIGWWIGYQHGKARGLYSSVAIAWLQLPSLCDKYLKEEAFSNIQSIIDQEMDEGIIQGIRLRRSIFLSKTEKDTLDRLLRSVFPLRKHSHVIKMQMKYNDSFRNGVEDVLAGAKKDGENGGHPSLNKSEEGIPGPEVVVQRSLGSNESNENGGK